MGQALYEVLEMQGLTKFISSHLSLGLLYGEEDRQ